MSRKAETSKQNNLISEEIESAKQSKFPDQRLAIANSQDK